LETILPVKNKSGSPSLLKSETAIPPPLKIYSLVRILKSFVSVIVFSKSTPVNSESSNLNKVDSFELHEISNTPKKGSIIMGLQNDLIKKAIE
jgi:hypothetical protein